MDIDKMMLSFWLTFSLIGLVLFPLGMMKRITLLNASQGWGASWQTFEVIILGGLTLFCLWLVTLFILHWIERKG